MPATKQQIRQIIANNNLSSMADVYSLLRESFKDILQNSWRQSWMSLSVMKRTGKVKCRHPIKDKKRIPK